MILRVKAAVVRTGLIGLLAAACAVPLLGQGQVFAPSQGRVENVTSKREGTTITVVYDLTSSDPSGVFKVNLMVSMAGSPFKPVSVTGDMNKVTPGKGKKIVWQVANDTDNQDYDLFKFDVTAVSVKLNEVTGDAAGTAKPTPTAAPTPTPTPTPAPPPPPPVQPTPTPNLPSASDLRGVWNGNYANSATAELRIDRQDGENFAGTLRLAMKAGDEMTELSVEGSIVAQTIEMREVIILRPGKLGNWNLGSGSGNLDPGGMRMTGRGKDRRTSYDWSFTRGATSGVQPSFAPPSERPSAPASADLTGSWEGKYAGIPAQVTLSSAGGATFTGTLMVTTSRGKAPTELAVEFVMSGQAIMLRELSVVAKGAVSSWNLGTATGVLKPDNRLMSGSGRDSRNSSYDWSFTRGATPAVQQSSVPAPARPAAPASTDLTGSWEGTYAGIPAQLTLSSSGGSVFAGTMLVTTSKGKAPTELAVEFVMTGQAITLRELRVVAKGAVSNWNLGSATGVLQPDNRLMSGSGRDSRSSFQWSFTRK